MTEDLTQEVLFERRGSLGLITLNRPEALNALNHNMVNLVAEALETFRNDDSVQTVAIRGAGERGLCAGGDIVSLYRDATEGGGSASAQFWADEYRLNAAIDAYPKPYVAIQDGIVLGGGIGVSAHGSHRIVTEKTRIGFPEVTIGFVPDVGASWLLSRAPHSLGTRIALTGEHIGAADAILVGLSDTFVPRDSIAELLTLLETLPADEAIARVAGAAPEGKLAATTGWSDEVFGASTVDAILEALEQQGEDGAALAADIRQKSPTSLAVTVEMLRQGRETSSLAESLQMEYRIAIRAHGNHDFVEGVRAQVIDKDRNPKWNPAELSDVTDDIVATYFEAPRQGDLVIAGALVSEEQS